MPPLGHSPSLPRFNEVCRTSLPYTQQPRNVDTDMQTQVKPLLIVVALSGLSGTGRLPLKLRLK